MFGQASQPRGRRARGDRAGGGLGWFGQGSAGVSAGSNLMNEAFNSMVFYAPRTSTITQTRGAGTPTETRATVATVTNNDGYLVTALSGELREEGARRIRNLVNKSEALAANWFANGSGVGTDGFTDKDGGTAATRIVTSTAAINSGLYISAGGVTGYTGLSSVWLRGEVGGEQVQFGDASNRTTKTLTTSWVRYSGVPVTMASGLFVCYSNSAAQTWYVCFPQQEDVTSQTTQEAGEYVSVGVLSAPYHGAGVDGVKYFNTDISGNPIPAATLDGSVVEAAATNLCTKSQEFDAWTASNGGAGSLPVVTTNQTVAPDGTTTADKVVFAAPAAGDLSALTSPAFITVTSSVYTSATYVKAFAAGDVDKVLLTRHAGAAAYTEITLSADWQRLGNTETAAGGSTTLDILLRPTFGGSTGTVSCYLWGAQVELGSYATAYQATTTAAVPRNKDVLDDQVASNLTAAAGTVAFTWTPSHDPSGTIALCGSYADADNYTALLHDATKYIWRKRIAGVNYDAELTAAYANGTSAKISMTWGASGINLAVDGTLGTAHANTDDAQLGTRWQWGADGNGGQQAGAAFKEMYLTPRTMSDAELQAVTA